MSQPDGPLPEDASVALLAFRDDVGLCSYYMQLAPSPGDDVDGLILWRTSCMDRRELRALMRVPADFSAKLIDEFEHSQAEGSVENISQGGACIVSSGQIALGGTVRVELSMPGAETLHLRGRVAHAVPALEGGGYRYGIRFLDVKPEGMDALLWFIQSRLKEMFTHSA